MKSLKLVAFLGLFTAFTFPSFAGSDDSLETHFKSPKMEICKDNLKDIFSFLPTEDNKESSNILKLRLVNKEFNNLVLDRVTQGISLSWQTLTSEDDAKLVSLGKFLSNYNSSTPAFISLTVSSINLDGLKVVRKIAGHALKHLKIFPNDISNEGTKEISKLNNLTTLNITDNVIGDNRENKISKLENFASLDTSHKNIETEGENEIIKLKKLVNLNIGFK